MAAKTHGTAFYFGIDGAYLGASAQIMSISLAKADKINEFVTNNSGQVASSIHDDQTDTLEVTFTFASGYTRPVIAAKMTLAATAQFDGDYRVENFTETKASKSFVEGKATLVKDEYLTLS
jgi:hypothetical protein